MSNSRLLFAIMLAGLAVAFFVSDLPNAITLDAIKAQQSAISRHLAENPITTTALYSLIYIVTTALSLPIAALLTLLGGAVFGLCWGTLIVSFASTIGATLAFLSARFLLKDAVQARFGRYLQDVNDGIGKNGGFYLFTARVVPAMPFFAVNVLMGLTPIKTRDYFWISQLGMLPGTLVYVNAGTQLAHLDSLSGIFSPSVIGSLALLGLLPWLAKKLSGKFNRH